MKKMTSQILFINLLLVGAIAAIIITTIMINSQNKNDAAVINIAGKQRMLTQRISKNIFYQNISATANPELFLEPVEEFETNLNILKSGDEKKGIYPPPTNFIDERIEKIKNSWIDARAAIEDFSDYKRESILSRDFVIKNNDKLLELSDLIVKKMVELNFPQRYIDRAGLQRMLSQKMLHNLMHFTISDNILYADETLKTIKKYDEGITSFKKEEKLLKSDELSLLIDSTLEVWSVYRELISTYISIQRSLNLSMKEIHILSEKLLNDSDYLTSLYEEYSKSRRTALEQFQYLSALIVGFITIFSLLTIRSIKAQFDEFLQRSKALANLAKSKQFYAKDMKLDFKGENELSQASNHLNEFLEKIATFSERSEDVKLLSNSLAEELLALAEEIQEIVQMLDIEDELKNRLLKQISIGEDLVIQSSEEILSAGKILENLKKSIDKIISDKG